MERPQIHKVWRITDHWCIVGDNGLAFYVGYVSVPEGHPWYEMDWDTISERSDVDVHGGLTYSGFRDWEGWGADGAPPGFYVGFDCGHAGDAAIEGTPLAPLYNSRFSDLWGPPHHWTIDEVASEVTRLAVQADIAGVMAKA